MEDQLLVRAYNVGLGDCIYVRIPTRAAGGVRQDDIHILIDCGNKFGELDRLGECIRHLKSELPDAGMGKKRLDLLVVSHPHEDHHKGFEEAFFNDLQIGHIWLSPAFNPQDSHAQGFHALQMAALRALNSLAAVAPEDLKDQVDELLSLSKAEAIEMLTTTLPQANGIEPLYVTAETPADQLRIFDDPDLTLKVLGPMQDIDSYYLGGNGLMAGGSAFTSQSAAGEAPVTVQALVDGYASIFAESELPETVRPKNISAQDFRKLSGRVHSNPLALVEAAGHAVNNLSVILLIEWRGRRLLFPGDAEWSEARLGAVEKGRANGSWNVMWQERRADLEAPLDFLKLGHHGSVNATPWTGEPTKTGDPHPINMILDALLPRPSLRKRPKARAVVSTLRTSRWPTIPDPALLEEVGKRVYNASRKYVETGKIHVEDGVRQPLRTDLQAQLTKTPDEPVLFVEVRLRGRRRG